MRSNYSAAGGLGDIVEDRADEVGDSSENINALDAKNKAYADELANIKAMLE